MSDGCCDRGRRHGGKQRALAGRDRSRRGGGARVRSSLTDTVVEEGAVVERAIIDKRVHDRARVPASAGATADRNIQIDRGRQEQRGPGRIRSSNPAPTIGTDVIASDYTGPCW
ncbi:MAG: hypothetical protein MZV64_62905 [Ignavibacteriales bacterium]|nr:hypothetical protein [Ignavibacteriales bacterium]